MLHTRSRQRGAFLLNFCVLLSFLVSFSAIGHAQVSGVNQAADDYNDNSSSSSSSSGSSGGSSSYSYDDDDDWDDDDDYDYGGELCGEAMAGCFEYAIIAFFEENAYLVEDRHVDNRPWLLGLQLMPQIGYQSSLHTVYQKPEARFRYGMIGMQLRVTDLSDNTGTYETTDWQFLSLHIPIADAATITYGQGIMWEHHTGNKYYEIMGGLELYFEDHKYNPTIEYRAAIAGDGIPSPRQELSIRFDYNFVDHGIFHLALSGGYMYQNYYQSVDFHMAQAGLNIGIY